MKSTGRACSLLLLTMVAVSSGRDAAEYFEEAQFQYSPSRPEDALVFFVADVPPLICEPKKSHEWVVVNSSESDFRLILPRGYSDYTCSFEGSATIDTNIKLLREKVPHLFLFKWKREIAFGENQMYCTTSSQLPDEYFQLRVQRPHEGSPVKCHLLNDRGRLDVRFDRYPTIVCQIGIEAGRFGFNLPGIAEDPLKCSFRVYSELPLGGTDTEERLYQSLMSELDSRVDGLHTRVVCFPQGSVNYTSGFELLLQSGASYGCGFLDAVLQDAPQPGNGTDF